jgi:hypothetical protein
MVAPSTFFSALTAVADILNTFTEVDVVGIFDSNLQQVFKEARPLTAEVRETSMVMQHPVETGSMIADNHIINPVEIHMPVMVDSKYYDSVYSQMKQAFVAATSFSVQTRTGTYQNMIIANMPHREDPDLYDKITMGLHFKEVLYVVPTSVSQAPLPANYSPAAPANSNTVQGGLKYPLSLSPSNITTVRSIATGFAFKYLAGGL